ncbi:atherin-like [Sorex fumeus]|uniref:atherin-like n=1 Tax=Sorex fumeus TaxID=62283 RepID=UPI0024AD5781|nr:atherin-like [Sorex fumeus]
MRCCKRQTNPAANPRLTGPPRLVSPAPFPPPPQARAAAAPAREEAGSGRKSQKRRQNARGSGAPSRREAAPRAPRIWHQPVQSNGWLRERLVASKSSAPPPGPRNAAPRHRGTPRAPSHRQPLAGRKGANRHELRGCLESLGRPEAREHPKLRARARLKPPPPPPGRHYPPPHAGKREIFLEPPGRAFSNPWKAATPEFSESLGPRECAPHRPPYLKSPGFAWNPEALKSHNRLQPAGIPGYRLRGGKKPTTPTPPTQARDVKEPQVAEP